MRFFNIGTLACVSTMLRSSFASLEPLRPDHAVAELLVIPTNITIMTPRAKKPGFDQQLFDFGSARTGFSELRRVFERQACETGTGSCPNDAGVEGAAAAVGVVALGCGVIVIDAATRRRMDAMARGAVQKVRSAALVVVVAIVATSALSSVAGLDAAQPARPVLPNRPALELGIPPAKGKISAVVASGTICYRDLGNEPRCRYPSDSVTTSTTPTGQSTTSTAPDISTSSTPAEPSTTSTPDITSTTSEPTLTHTSTEQITTSVSTLPPVTTRAVVTTAPQVSSRSSPVRGSSVEGGAITTETTGSNAAINSNSPSVNIGAIAGGTVAGVIAIGVLVLILIVWRRRRADYTQAPTGPGQEQEQEPDFAYNQSAHERPYDHWQPIPRRPIRSQAAHHPGAAPPTPGIGDPFLTPNMAQHGAVRASYFDAGHATPAPSGVNTGTETQYTGLPEPQQPDYSGTGAVALAGVSVVPSPRRDGAHPRPLPMSVTSMQGDANSSTRWSGYADSTPSSGLNAAGYAGYPEVENNTSQPRWSPAPPALNVLQHDRAPSTVYQPSSHGGAAYDDIYPPGMSPPPVSVHGGITPSVGGSGLPSGAAPPAPSTNFAPPPY